ncbi:Uncharacterised protein [Acinetobacter haemolyticus]|nr:DUF4256 domain-containing protein [Acinetobacter haemolyticus]SUU08130.1 Uncharacterised protein [Acinetobacter haemolyticus]
MTKKQYLNAEQINALMMSLKQRFEQNMHRHQGLDWADVADQLKQQPNKLWSLNQMEMTGGEPDVVCFDSETSTCISSDLIVHSS